MRPIYRMILPCRWTLKRRKSTLILTYKQRSSEFNLPKRSCARSSSRSCKPTNSATLLTPTVRAKRPWWREFWRLCSRRSKPFGSTASLMRLSYHWTSTLISFTPKCCRSTQLTCSVGKTKAFLRAVDTSSKTSVWTLLAAFSQISRPRRRRATSHTISMRWPTSCSTSFFSLETPSAPPRSLTSPSLQASSMWARESPRHLTYRRRMREFCRIQHSLKLRWGSIALRSYSSRWASPLQTSLSLSWWDKVSRETRAIWQTVAVRCQVSMKLWRRQWSTSRQCSPPCSALRWFIFQGKRTWLLRISCLTSSALPRRRNRITLQLVNSSPGWGTMNYSVKSLIKRKIK